MSDEDFKIFLDDFYSLLVDLEAAVKAMRERVNRLTGGAETHLIEAPGPCMPEDPAIKWLTRKCDEVKAKHPESEWTFMRSPDNAILGLRVKTANPEVKADYESVAKWAFEKASQRPTEK
jgi:hypothetical protein